ncbi:hypothetical protein [Nocardia brasiliensis]|uniref:Uncharacterized protein n=1 Tax=Nocardia brasiliensis (strain ATCC 700358 / HUJEG-1) TaxID=1133849 RepID=K0F680_NOCB7|nr:hypothetical protein [Nocardia brasiliensis]AFU02946.1 hypothetical protein O3I_024975 [Nocardia brasiliensis ATCC 700358]OCF86019.1 hypothetical protein AW168_33190 [Nocardia brasiliensis]
MAFVLWAAAQTQPLAELTDDRWALIRTNEVYPFRPWGTAPMWVVLFVDCSLLAVIATGAALRAASSRDRTIRAYASVTAHLVFVGSGCGIGVLVQTLFHSGTPLSGMWLITVALVLVCVATITVPD